MIDMSRIYPGRAAKKRTASALARPDSWKLSLTHTLLTGGACDRHEERVYFEACLWNDTVRALSLLYPSNSAVRSLFRDSILQIPCGTSVRLQSFGRRQGHHWLTMARMVDRQGIFSGMRPRILRCYSLENSHETYQAIQSTMMSIPVTYMALHGTIERLDFVPPRGRNQANGFHRD
jgi:hypothetical protein